MQWHVVKQLKIGIKGKKMLAGNQAKLESRKKQWIHNIPHVLHMRDGKKKTKETKEEKKVATFLLWISKISVFDNVKRKKIQKARKER